LIDGPTGRSKVSEVFFDVRGEALDMRGETPTYANIPLRRIPNGKTSP